ncbi:MAG: hypothetical protein IB618_02970 [Candidatus Pacearchaeota archaeon]|nr:MAG: hypothetical protein IB618_02970 [Candidatus Pacearchaeota archaeon]
MKRFFAWIKENVFLILESIILLLIPIFNFISSQILIYQKIISWVLFLLILIDVLFKINEKIREKKKERALKMENEKRGETERKRYETIEEMKKNLEEQKNFNLEYKEKKERSIKILNKFFNESLLNEEDILSLAKSSSYYILFIYSWPFPEIKNKRYKFITTRQYPLFLNDIGFTRMGSSRSTFFIIKKDRLEKKYHNIASFKKFLNKNLEEIRKEEFKMYLEELKKQDKKVYTKYSKKSYSEYLKINFLLLENIIHSGNLGLVSGEYIGLGGKKQVEEINKQILSGIELSEIDLKENVKIKIRDYFQKQDFNLLLEGIKQRTINKISKSRVKLKDELNIANVLEIAGKNKQDLQKALDKIGIPNAKNLATKMKQIAEEYLEALNDLKINL